MRKSGLQMLLSSMGIEIDPVEVMAKYNEAKNMLPQLAAFVSQLDARLTRIEEKIDGLSTNSGRMVTNGRADCDRIGSGTSAAD